MGKKIRTTRSGIGAPGDYDSDTRRPGSNAETRGTGGNILVQRDCRILSCSALMEPFGTCLPTECQCRDLLTAPAAVCKLASAQRQLLRKYKFVQDRFHPLRWPSFTLLFARYACNCDEHVTRAIAHSQKQHGLAI